ncbi:MAG: cupin [Lachnospiraceae bacterium]
MKIKDKEMFDQANVFGQGMENSAYARYFIGKSYLNPLTKPGESTIALANVTFEPGCRNNWHIHHAKTGGGQILICTAGSGWYQEEGKAPAEPRAGMRHRDSAGSKTLARRQGRQLVFPHRL